jgi:hypothetical protein
MDRTRGQRGKGSVGCVIWLAIVVLVGYALFKIIPVKVAASHFEDFMTEEAGFGSIKSTQQIEKEILAKAKELNLPVTKDNLSVTRARDMLVVEAHYEIAIDFFGGAYKYVWKFNPLIQRPTFAV